MLFFLKRYALKCLSLTTNKQITILLFFIFFALALSLATTKNNSKSSVKMNIIMDINEMFATQVQVIRKMKWNRYMKLQCVSVETCKIHLMQIIYHIHISYAFYCFVSKVDIVCIENCMYYVFISYKLSSMTLVHNSLQLANFIT